MTMNWPHEHHDELEDQEEVHDERDVAPAHEEERPTATMTAVPETADSAQTSTEGELEQPEGVDDEGDVAPAPDEERPTATLTAPPETDGVGPTSTDEPHPAAAEEDADVNVIAPEEPGPALGRFQALDPAEMEGYRSRWESIQIGFLDDPKGAVEQADAVVGEVLGRLTQRHQALRAELNRQSDQGSDTESLRLAVRTYRSFFQVLVKS
jgi:hypothetical protein